jgi:hypothetical protein
MTAKREAEHPVGDPLRFSIISRPDGDAAVTRDRHLERRAPGREIQVPGHGHEHDQHDSATTTAATVSSVTTGTRTTRAAQATSSAADAPASTRNHQTTTRVEFLLT